MLFAACRNLTMARRKTLPESVRAKLALAERLAELRSELFGERGGPEMARRLGIPVRTWYNYEGGVTLPAEVVLNIMTLTSVEASWLIHGEGPKFRRARSEPVESGATPAVTIGALLRTALQLLENEDPSAPSRLHELTAERREESAPLFGLARPNPIKIEGDKVCQEIEVPKHSPTQREDLFGPIRRSEASPVSKNRATQGTRHTTVDEILSRANSLKAPAELEELTAGLLALRARKLAPVVSGEETRLLLAISDGVSVELRDRVASLIEMRDDCGLTVAENSELMQLADEVERRGMERLDALSKLAEIRGVSLRELMNSLGVAADDRG
jgi:hypothetical protein